MLIRRAEIKDIQTIADFQIAMARETENMELDRETIHVGVSAVFTDSNKGFYIVAESDCLVAGSLLVTYEWSDWRNKTVFWIQSVYVKPEFRGRGVYKSLYEHVRNLANTCEDVAGIRLYVDKTNISAQKVYEKTGMNGEHYLVFEAMKN